MQLSYYTKFLRHVYFPILRCAHFATPCLNFVLFRKLFILNHFDCVFLSNRQKLNLFLCHCYFKMSLKLVKRLYQRYNDAKLQNATTRLYVSARLLGLNVYAAGLHMTVAKRQFSQCPQAIHESHRKV